jgi:hypothetical protein
LILMCHLKQNSICCRTNQRNAVLIIKETYLLYMYLINTWSIHIYCHIDIHPHHFTLSLNVQTCYVTAKFSSWFVIHVIKKFLARFGCQRFITVIEKCLSSGPSSLNFCDYLC